MRMSQKAFSVFLSVVLVLNLIPPAPNLAYAADSSANSESMVEEQVENSSRVSNPLKEGVAAKPEDDSNANSGSVAGEAEEQVEDGDSTDDAALHTDAGIAAGDEGPILGDAIEATNEGAESHDGISLRTQSTYAQPQFPSIDEIRSFIEANPFDILSNSVYDSEPSVTAPYAPGTLSSASTQNALKALNAMRYIAGVDYNVTNNPEYQTKAQAAALVNKVNNQLSHEPMKPEDMDDSLFQVGYEGSGSSNIAWTPGYNNAAKSIIQYLDDLGNNNSGVAGHRRWLLSSRLGQVGIGHVDAFNATYVMDSSNSSMVTDVAWPARKMPTDFFDKQAQWSFSTVTQDIGTASSITVKVTRSRDNKVWNLSGSDVSVKEVTESGSFVGYDKNGCIIWSLPDAGSYHDGDVFNVTITGDKSSKSYSVEFFDLYHVGNIEMHDSRGSNIQSNGSYQMVGASGAQRFYFLPRFTEGTYPTQSELQTIADTVRNSQTATYSSSNESVATIAAYNDHNHFATVNSEKVYCDWIANITPVGSGTTTITATLSNGVSKSFQLTVMQKSINPSNDSNASLFVSGLGPFTYNGQSQHPTYSVYYKNSCLTQGTDYTVTYDDDVNAGTHTATITGIGAYAGTVEETFTINPASIGPATIASINSRTYTGSDIEPEPTVTLGGKTLVKDTDYTLTYADNVDAGTATVTVTGQGNYTGTKSTTFSISRAKIDVPAATNPTYNGQQQTGVSAGEGYTLSGTAQATDAGGYTATATPDANHCWADGSTGAKTLSWVISAASLADAEISQIADQPFTGSDIKPEPTVTLGGKTLVEDTDYTLSYADNVNVGTATVTITGKNNYTGTKSITFAIVNAQVDVPEATDHIYNGQLQVGVPAREGYTLSGTAQAIDVGTYQVTAILNAGYRWADESTGTKLLTWRITAASIANATVHQIGAQPYTGSDIKPKPTVTLGGRTLVEGTDYTLSYQNNINIGTDSATVVVTGKGNYDGTTSATFSITRAQVAVPEATNRTYNGQQQTGVPVGEGYTLTGIAQATDAGSYSATATPDANHCWTDGTTEPKELPWSISAASLADAEISQIADQPYTGSAIQPKPTVTLGGRTLTEGTDYTLGYENNVNVGKATITVQSKGTNYAGSKSVDFNIVKADIQNAEVSAIEDQVYKGSAFQPKPTVTLGNRQLEEGADYTLSYQDNENAGTATVTVTGKGNYTGTKRTSFTISRASISVPVTTNPTYNGQLQVGVPAGNGYTLSGTAQATNVGNYTATAAPDANHCWTDGSTEAKTLSWSISAASLADAEISQITDQPYTGSDIKSEPTVTLGGKTLVKDTDYTLSYESNVNVGTATITITGKGNYTGTKSTTFSVVRAQVDVPTATDRTYNGQQQTGVPAGEGYTLAGTAQATNAGGYSATATPDANHCWTDGSTGAKTLSWSISAANLADASVSKVADQPFTGSAIEPKPTVILGGRTLVEGSDYTLDYQNNVNTGKATITVQGKGTNYVGSKPVYFNIIEADIQYAEVSKIEDWVYTGDAIRPEPEVRIGDRLLQKGVDYTLTYKNNIKAGTATVTVTGMGIFSGSKSVDFKIAKQPIYSAVIYSQHQTYTGSAIKYKPIVRLGQRQLKEGVDYRISAYGGNVNVGLADIEIEGIGSYEGYTLGVFQIMPASIAKATISKIANQPYTGKAVTPRPIVKVGTRTLALNKDYTLSYKNNVKAGTATVTIKGKGNYTGSRSATFKIVAPSVRYRTHVQSIGDQAWKYNGQPSGTFGMAKRLEGIWIGLPTKPVSGSIQYRTQVQTFGWQGWRSEGAMSGTHGLAKRLEAIQIRLTGQMAQKYDVWYRVHAQSFGWMGWAKNGAKSGTAGLAKRLEAIQILVLPKGSKAPATNYGGYKQMTAAPFRQK